jgi:hypothetical protein
MAYLEEIEDEMNKNISLHKGDLERDRELLHLDEKIIPYWKIYKKCYKYEEHGDTEYYLVCLF